MRKFPAPVNAPNNVCRGKLEYSRGGELFRVMFRLILEYFRGVCPWTIAAMSSFGVRVFWHIRSKCRASVQGPAWRSFGFESCLSFSSPPPPPLPKSSFRACDIWGSYPQAALNNASGAPGERRCVHWTNSHNDEIESAALRARCGCEGTSRFRATAKARRAPTTSSGGRHSSAEAARASMPRWSIADPQSPNPRICLARFA